MKYGSSNLAIFWSFLVSFFNFDFQIFREFLPRYSNYKDIETLINIYKERKLLEKIIILLRQINIFNQIIKNYENYAS